MTVILCWTLKDGEKLAKALSLPPRSYLLAATPNHLQGAKLGSATVHVTDFASREIKDAAKQRGWQG